MSTVDEAELAMYEIQGDVLPGFKKPHQAFLMLAVGSTVKARKTLAALINEVTHGQRVLEANADWKARRLATGGRPVDPGVWINVAFTWEGLQALAPNQVASEFEAYRSFREPSTDLERLFGAANAWKLGGLGAGSLHMLVNFAGDDPVELQKTVREVSDALTSGGGWTTSAFEDGHRITDAHGHAVEHFGFRDGLSSVGVRGVDSEKEPLTPRAKGQQTSAWSNLLITRNTEWTRALSASIVADRALQSTEIAFASPGVPLVEPWQFVLQPGKVSHFLENGSFMVWLRLREHVGRFWAAAEAYAQRLSTEVAPVDKEGAAALFVGRHQDGTPLIFRPVLGRSRARRQPIADEALNHFAYRTATYRSAGLDGKIVDGAPYDPGAKRGGPICPVGAHIRKMNNRVTPTLDMAVLRRSITYGPRVTTFSSPSDGEAGDDRGLLFVCYQTNIKNQFAALQGGLANQEGAPEPQSPVDLVSSRTAMTKPTVRTITPRPDGRGSLETFVPTQWVEMTGGSYFFVPSISSLRVLADRR